MIKELIFIIIIIIIIFYILRFNKDYFNKINFNNKCYNLTLSDCINKKGCGYVLDNHNGYCVEGDFKGPFKTKNKSFGFKWYYNDDYTRALIANNDNYRNLNNKVFD